MTENIFKKLRNTRKGKKNNFYEKIKITEERWNELETDEEKPNSEEILKISKYFNIPAEDILNGKVLNELIKALLILIFILNICSIWIGLATTMKTPSLENPVKTTYQTFNADYSSFAFIVLGISIISLIAGIYFKRKGYKCTKNIITAIIFILIVLPMCPTFITNTNNDTTNIKGKRYVQEISEEIDFQIPVEKAEILVMDKTLSNSFSSINYQISYVFDDKNDNTSFENEVKKSDKWLNKLDTYQQQFLLQQTTHLTNTFNYFMIYNKTTKEYNTLPQKGGNYELYIVEYNVNGGILNMYNLSVQIASN